MNKIKIPLNKPTFIGNEARYIIDALEKRDFSEEGKYVKECERWFEEKLRCEKVFLTSSCTSALEICAHLIEIKQGDEVVMPSYNFVSAATAFVSKGAKIIFVDIRPDTMNINEELIEDAITKKTKAILPVHYAGVSCEMEKILKIAKKYGIFVIEDAAHGMLAKYNGKNLGTIGDLGVFSFHHTKNYTSAGQGGLLIINKEIFKEKAEIIIYRGTNKKDFLLGKVKEYVWIDIGGNYRMSNINAAFLYAQLEKADEIKKERVKLWQKYKNELKDLEIKNEIELPQIPSDCKINGHIFYIKTKDEEERRKIISFLRENGIESAPHYVPLHISPAGKKFGEFKGEDKFTTKESKRILRLPIFYGMKEEDVEFVVEKIYEFFKRRKRKEKEKKIYKPE
jgi:dTDP-4-amino-4,6-dideoxygalactose transaminase